MEFYFSSLQDVLKALLASQELWVAVLFVLGFIVTPLIGSRAYWAALRRGWLGSSERSLAREKLQKPEKVAKSTARQKKKVKSKATTAATVVAKKSGERAGKAASSHTQHTEASISTANHSISQLPAEEEKEAAASAKVMSIAMKKAARKAAARAKAAAAAAEEEASKLVTHDCSEESRDESAEIQQPKREEKPCDSGNSSSVKEDSMMVEAQARPAEVAAACGTAAEQSEAPESQVQAQALKVAPAERDQEAASGLPLPVAGALARCGAASAGESEVGPILPAVRSLSAGSDTPKVQSAGGISVKNTFIEVVSAEEDEEVRTPPFRRRANSLPALPTASLLLSFSLDAHDETKEMEGAQAEDGAATPSAWASVAGEEPGFHVNSVINITAPAWQCHGQVVQVAAAGPAKWSDLVRTWIKSECSGIKSGQRLTRSRTPYTPWPRHDPDGWMEARDAKLWFNLMREMSPSFDGTWSNSKGELSVVAGADIFSLSSKKRMVMSYWTTTSFMVMEGGAQLVAQLAGLGSELLLWTDGEMWMRLSSTAEVCPMPCDGAGMMKTAGGAAQPQQFERKACHVRAPREAGDAPADFWSVPWDF